MGAGEAGQGKAYLVAVAGPVGAGKTSLVKRLSHALDDATAIHLDSYERVTERPIEDIARWMERGADIDEFEFPALAADLARLKRGESVVDPASGRAIHAARYVLFETQYGRAHRATGCLVDLLIWLDTPLDVALARKLREFVAALLHDERRGGSRDRLAWLGSYLDTYLRWVRALLEIQRERVAPQADLILDGRAEPAALVAQAEGEIRRRLP